MSCVPTWQIGFDHLPKAFHVIADSAGRAIASALAPGQAHELPHAMPLLAALPGVPL
jgi:hypothetical protein